MMAVVTKQLISRNSMLTIDASKYWELSVVNQAMYSNDTQKKGIE